MGYRGRDNLMDDDEFDVCMAIFKQRATQFTVGLFKELDLTTAQKVIMFTELAYQIKIVKDELLGSVGPNGSGGYPC
jgi:hypothetical protein